MSVRWGDPVTAELSDALALDLGWPRRDMIRVSTAPTGRGSVRIEHFAMALLDEAQRSGAVESTRKLREFIARNVAKELEVVAIWGFEPRAVVSLMDGISLQPFSALPPSIEKDRLTQESDNPFVLSPKPQAALVRKFTYGPIIDPLLAPLAAEASQLVEKEPRLATLLDIVRSLTLVVPGPVAAIAHWYQAAEPLPVLHIGGGSGYEILRQFSFPGRQEIIDESHVKLISRYVGLDLTTKQALRVPLDRLNSSKLHFHAGHLVDSALDLGIATESLLLSDEEPTELSYRFRMRGAVLKGGDRVQRRDTLEVLKALYTLRSQAAHGKPIDRVKVVGRPKAVGYEHIGAFMAEATLLASELIRKVIELGSVPDWDELMLGDDGV